MRRLEMRRPITQVAKEVNALEMQGIPLTFRKKQELLYNQDVLNGKISVEEAYKKMLSTKTVTSFLTEKPSASLPELQTSAEPEQTSTQDTTILKNPEPVKEDADLNESVQMKYGGALPDLPKYQDGTSVFPKTTDKYGNTGTRVKLVGDIDQDTGKAYAAYAPEYSLPEVTVTGSKNDITNSAALQRWSKENDPIAYAARKGMSEAADYVAPALGLALAPAGAPLLGTGVRGLAAAGEATYGALAPYVSAAWNASLPGMSSIPGATVGNAINAGFATHGATHIVPDTKKFIKDPSLEKGLNVGMDALEMLPMVGPAVKGSAEILQASKSAGLKGRNFAAAKLLSSQLNKPLPKVQPKSSPIKRVDLIDKSTIGIKNDWAKALSESEYNQLLEDLYLVNEYEYNNPIVSWKNLRPASFYQELGNSASRRVEGGLVDSTGWYDEGMFFKDKFCPPGSECAKTANATASKIYTDLTGKAFNTEANAHNAWHMEDQMTRHGGKLVESSKDLKVGDRILMGNEVSQATEVPGYTADPSVRHAGTYIGLSKLGDTYYPVLLESGKNNPLYVNPLQNTFTGENTVKKILRAAQFQGTETGKGLVEKNLRYAFRDAPSIASYSSENKVAQGILDKANIHREKIKRIHDITNDEFDEIVNTLIGIGGQETKLQGSLPGSKLSKLKIQLQDGLTDIGLTAPIKRTINLGKKAANMASKSSKQKAGLPEYPGTSKIEMEAAKLSASENISFKDAVAQVKAQYQDKPKFTLSTIEPSKGIFRQKFQTTTDLVEGIGQDIKGKNSVENAIGLMAENFKKIKKLYPDATPRELMDLTTLMWNSPGKAKNKELVDFFLFKKNNPDPSRFNFDYVRKVNELKNRLINIHPKGEREPIFEFTRKGYPEIEYKTGGYLPKYQDGTPEILTDKNEYERRNRAYQAYSDSLAAYNDQRELFNLAQRSNWSSGSGRGNRVPLFNPLGLPIDTYEKAYNASVPLNQIVGGLPYSGRDQYKNIKPAGYLNQIDTQSGNAVKIFPFYKKPVQPVQPVIYRKPEPTMAIPRMEVEEKPEWFKQKRMIERMREYKKPEQPKRKYTAILQGVQGLQ